MASDPPVQNEPGATDPLTAAAELRIKVEPYKGVSAGATVPPDDARYLIATFGIVSVVAMSTGSAVLLVHAAPCVALAALVLGFVATVLVAVCGRVPGPARTRVHVKGRKERSESSPGD